MKKIPGSLLRDLCGSVFSIIIAVIALSQSYKIRITKMARVNSAVMPKAVSYLLLILGIIWLIITIVEIRKNSKITAETKEDSRQKIETGSVSFFDKNADWLSMALIITYTICIGIVGFIPASIVYMFLQAMLLSVKGHRNMFLIIGLSVACPILVYLLFSRAFSLTLPH